MAQVDARDDAAVGLGGVVVAARGEHRAENQGGQWRDAG